MKSGKVSAIGKTKRSGMRRWLRSLLGESLRVEVPQTRLLLEPLESRQLMAGDVDLNPFATTSNLQEDDTSTQLTQTMQGSGESAQDLVAFAKALKAGGVTFFGAIWCPFCNEQKALFGDAAQYLPFVEVTNPDHSPNATGTAEGVTTYPTWEFQNGTRVTGVQTLAKLSELSGIAIPSGNKPTFAPIGNQTVLTGSPLYIPVDASNPDGSPVTITVSSSNTSLVQASVLQNNRSVRMNLQNWGSMTFELFEGLAPAATARFIQLIQSGFYNKTATNQIIFHRVIDDFVLQAGDPTGTGSGGSTLGDFDDDFNLDLQHNRTGLLSYAKSGDDTNDSQFFITEGAQRHLDFNHSIFGMLIEGESVREGISETPTNSSNRPTSDVIINSMSVFNDALNGVIQLKAAGNQTGTAQITVTVTNADGQSSSEVFNVTVAADTVNTAPFLNPVTTPAAVPAGQPVQIQLSSKDVEGDAVTYFARKVGTVNYTTSVNQSTGVVTVTPPAGFTGQFDVVVGVNQPAGLTSAGAEDTQTVKVTIAGGAPTSVDLLAASDSGASNSDNITNASSLQFLVSGVTAGATVKLKVGSTVLGEATVATGQTTVTITTTKLADLGNGTHNVVATSTQGGTESGASPALAVTLDTTVPAQFTGDIRLTAITGSPYVVDLQHPDEPNGLRYSLQTSPAGMTLDGATGVVQWTPQSSQTSPQQFTVQYVDLAGNTSTQTFNVPIAASALANVRMQITNTSGTPITTIAAGQEFLVKLFVQDVRGVTAQGLFSAYMDVFFNSDLAEAAATTPLSYTSGFPSVRRGTAGKGLIDEFGATTGNTSPVGPDEQELGTIRLKALKAGTLTITTNSADTSGSDFLAYGIDTAVEKARVQFPSGTLAITGGFTVANDTFNVDEDATNFAMNVLSNDSPVTGTTLTISKIGTNPTKGTVTISADKKSLSYTPNANYNGGDTFTYVAVDQSGSEQTATVTVQVQPVNDAPTANPDSFRFEVNSTGNVVDVLRNDVFTPDTGETLIITAVGTTSQGGTVTIQGSGNSIVYTPKSGFTGTETFTYTISDRSTGGLTSTATATVNVGVDNSPPNAVNDAFPIAEDAAAADFNLVANDSTADAGETISVSAVGTPSNGGTVSLLANGTGVRYQPKANFFGAETVTYTLRDSRGATSTGTVTFTVTGANDPPTAVNDTPRVVKESGATAIQVLDNDSSAPDATETLRVTQVSATSKGGTVTINSAGTVVFYTPPSATFTGTDTFTYTIADPSGATATATVTVEVADYKPRQFAVEVEAGALNFQYGLPLTLTGVDSLGKTVTLTGTPDANGKVTFSNQAPGNYTVSLGNVPFLTNGSSQSVQIKSNATDGDSTGNMIDLGTLHAKYISILDFVTITPTESVLVALRPGEAYTWLTRAPNIGNITNPNVRLSADGNMITISGTQNGQSVTKDLPVSTSGSLVQLRGQEGEYRLFRIATNNSVFPSTTSAAAVTTDTTQTGGSGEPTFDPSLLGAGSELALALPQGDVFSTDGSSDISHDEPSTVSGGNETPTTTNLSSQARSSTSTSSSDTELPEGAGEPESEEDSDAFDAVFNQLG